ncbi:MAG: DUF4342 domain-containing protein [Caldilineaceae bacterium]|nr:DUF4342 domain-containing protein [Caldilineaceae bacterium]
MTSPINETEKTINVEEIPTPEAQSQSNSTPPPAGSTWVEEIELAGSQLVERVKELIAEGNVRRLIIRTAEDKIMLEIPLTTGVAVGGVVTLLAPVIAALGALAALLAKVKIQIVREEG